MCWCGDVATEMKKTKWYKEFCYPYIHISVLDFRYPANAKLQVKQNIVKIKTSWLSMSRAK